MLTKLKLTGVGEMPDYEFELGRRFNVLTGDNGLGKTFLLDLIWYALTRRWLHDVNPQLLCGFMAQPSVDEGLHEIAFDLDTTAKHTIKDYKVSFNFDQQAWVGKPGRPYSSGLVIYAHADGGFSIWDPARNYWIKKGNIDAQDREPAFVFTNQEVWGGQDKNSHRLLGGLLADVALWQVNSTSLEFKVISSLLGRISPTEFKIQLGKLQRYSLDDVREIPSVDMGYGPVPVLWASSAVKRILSLAYILVWSFSQHIRAAELLRTPPTRQITLLFDELDAHLHPKWQRTIMPSLVETTREMMSMFSKEKHDCQIQIVASTHSPLVMASLEDSFDRKTDKWFDFDYKSDGGIDIHGRDFEAHGTADSWLHGKAFDLSSTYSPKVGALIGEAERLLDADDSARNVGKLKSCLRELASRLPVGNDLVFRLDAMIKDMEHAKG